MGRGDAWTPGHANVAASVQTRLAEVILDLARRLHARTGTMAGGVARNCVANSRVAAEGPFEHVWVQPAPGDAGTALGTSLRPPTGRHRVAHARGRPGRASSDDDIHRRPGRSGRAETAVVFDPALAVATELDVELRLPEAEPVVERTEGTAGCDWPWRSTYVTSRGKVQLCCMVRGVDRAVMGDLLEHDLATVWAGDAYAGFRSRPLSADDRRQVCRGCSTCRGRF